MSLSSFEVRALRDLAERIREQLQTEYRHAGGGTGMSMNPHEAAMAWMKRVSFIQGLEAALGYCEDVERDLTTPKRKKED